MSQAPVPFGAGAIPEREPGSRFAGENPFYEYIPLHPKEPSLRLLVLKKGNGQDLQGEIVHTSFVHNVRPYEAVSYAWGPGFMVDTISLSGRRLPIAFNLSLILQDLRSPYKDRVLWVDAVCIDQGNEDEKSHQVQQMKTIYSGAERVLFCVGRPTSYTDLLMASLLKLQNELESRALDDWPVIKAAWQNVQIKMIDNHLSSQSKQLVALNSLQVQGLNYILEQSWFRRVWIIQEVANAREGLVYCGAVSVSAKAFVLGAKLLNIPRGNDGWLRRRSVRVLDLMSGSSREIHNQDLYSLLLEYRYAEATDERDKVYALLGVCTDTQIHNFKIDYGKPIRDVILDTISYICSYDTKAFETIPYSSADEFFGDLKSLDNTMLLQFLHSGDMSSALSLMQHRGKHIYITEKILEAATSKAMLEAGVTEQLLQHQNTENVVFSKYGIVRTLLWSAIVNGHETVVKLLVERGFHLYARDEKGSTPLLVAARYGDTAIARLLLEKGDDLEVRDSDGWTPLSAAAQNGHVEVVKLLLEKGAEITKKDDYGWAPLLWAARNGYEAVVKTLLDNGVYIEAKDETFQRTSLVLTVINGHEASTELLLKEGADIETQDKLGYTPLHWAITNNHKAVIRLLIENGADIEAQGTTGYTPLHWAVINNQTTMVQLLLEKCAGIEAQGETGYTPLYWAVKNNHEAVVRLLLEKGADIEAQDGDGTTPLYWAAKNNMQL